MTFQPETFAQVIRRTLRTWKPIQLSKGSAWTGIYFNAPCWYFSAKANGTAVARWLGPTQVARIVFDPLAASRAYSAAADGRAHLKVAIRNHEVTIKLWRSKNWWKLDGRRALRAKGRRALNPSPAPGARPPLQDRASQWAETLMEKLYSWTATVDADGKIAIKAKTFKGFDVVLADQTSITGGAAGCFAHPSEIMLGGDICTLGEVMDHHVHGRVPA